MLKDDIEEMVIQYNEDKIKGEPIMTYEGMLVILGLQESSYEPDEETEIQQVG